MSRLKDIQTVHIPLAQGLDTKSDIRALQPPRLLKCENAVFDEVGGIQARAGFTSLGVTNTAGSSITAARVRAVASRGDELLLFAQSKCYSWSAKESKWDDRGRYDGWTYTQKTVAHARTDQVVPDRAEAGNVIVYAWEELATGSTGVRYRVIDKTTGSTMDSSSAPFISGAWRPRVRAINGVIHVYYQTGTSLKVHIIDPDNVYGTVGVAAATLTTSMTNSATASPYDVDVVGTTAYIAFVDSVGPTARVLACNSAGTITVAERDTGRTAHQVAISYNTSSARVALGRVVTTAGVSDTIFLDWLVAALTDDSNVNISSNVTEAEDAVTNITVVSKAGQTADLFWSVGTEPSNSIRKAPFSSSALSSAAVVVAYRSSLGSRAIHWTDGSATRTMLFASHESSQQPCYVLLDTDYTAAGGEVGIMGRFLYQEGRGNLAAAPVLISRKGTLPQIESLGSSQYACALTFRRGLDNPTDTPYSEFGIRDVVLTHGDPKAYRGVMEGKTLYLPGAYLAQYDGTRVYESGFLLYPEGVTAAAPADSGGQLGAGIYMYRFYWEWRNSSGELERSTYAGNVSVNTGALSGVDNTVSFTVPTLPNTSKSNIYLAVYRTVVGGTTFYRISSLDPDDTTACIKNTVAAASVTFADTTITDAALILKEIDPLATGELDPVTPNGSNVLAGGQSRLFIRDPEDTSMVRFSKLRLSGDAVMFNDALTIQLPQDGGEITGIDVTENALVVFKERATYVVAGQGPDNFGVPSYQPPQKVSELGCTEVRSIVRVPQGVMRMTKKGIYLLDNGYRDTYIGAPVEDYNSLTIAGTIHAPTKHRVNFVCTATGQLVYDYLVGEWSLWTSTTETSNALGISAVAWGDTPIHLVSSTAPYKYVSGGSGADFIVQTGWIKLSDLQGFYRLRTVNVLGECVNSHALGIYIYYDYVDTAVDQFSLQPSISAGQTEQMTVYPSRQKVEAIKVQVAAFDGGPYVNLTAISLEWLPLPGARRLGSSFVG